MDFGIIYMRDGAASRAAMWLGCLVFLLFIFVPLITFWLFVPLYLAILVIGALRRFEVESPTFTFLLPLSGFFLAIALFILFWWAIPSIVNFARDCVDMISLNMDDHFLFRESIPDDKCYLYFFGVVGGSIGSIFSSIILYKLINNPTKESKLEPYGHDNKPDPKKIEQLKKQYNSSYELQKLKRQILNSSYSE